jgi:hypothetical protein
MRNITFLILILSQNRSKYLVFQNRKQRHVATASRMEQSHGQMVKQIPALFFMETKDS